jgi:hypothetical protein
MTKTKMLEAKSLIQQKQYDEARTILETINHPTAEQWLAKLDAMEAPRQRTNHYPLEAEDPEDLLDDAVAIFVERGWVVTSQTNESIQLEKLRGVNRNSMIAFLLIFGITVFPFLFMLLAIALSGKERVLLQVDSRGRVRITGTKTNAKLRTAADAIPVAESVKGVGYRGAIKIMVWITVILSAIVIVGFTVLILVQNAKL